MISKSMQSQPRKISISAKTRKSYYLALVFATSAGIADILFAQSIGSGAIEELYVVLASLFVLRISLFMISNYFTLNYSMLIELDLKLHAFRLRDSAARESCFSTVSHTVAHNMFAGQLRLMSEVIIAFLLLAYVLLYEFRLLTYGAISFGVLFPVLFYIYQKTKMLRVKAAKSQLRLLNFGRELIGITDRAEQLGVIPFLQNKIKENADSYIVSNRSSLFVAQTFKPLAELLIFGSGIYFYNLGLIDGAIIYVGYRLVSSVIVIVNMIPLIQHYRSQYKSLQ